VAHQYVVFSNIDGFVKSRIFPFIWIPAYAGMTIKQLISIRYTIRHTRECGYPDVKKTFYEFINIDDLVKSQKYQDLE
jgi:hypothetical protein